MDHAKGNLTMVTGTPAPRPPEEQLRPVIARLGVAARWMLAATLVCALASLGLSGAALVAVLKREPVPAQSVDFGGQVRAFLESNPQVIVDSVKRADERQKEAEAKEATDQLASHADEIFNDPKAPVGGNAAGDAVLVEFFDYNCPYCKKAAPVVDQLIQSDPKAKIVYKEFPILGPGSVFAARAALASQKQRKYLAFHEALYASHGPITEASALEVAKNVGIDVDQLKKDMADPAIDEAIKRNLALADALRISGTPTFVSRKQITPGLVGLDVLKQMMASVRKG
jgi:protein-disulfide isomerase